MNLIFLYIISDIGKYCKNKQAKCRVNLTDIVCVSVCVSERERGIRWVEE